MQIGKLDRYVRIEQQSTAQDEWGETVNTWSTYKECWASVLDVTSRQQELTEGVQSPLRVLKRPCRVMLRYDENINSTMRIVMLDRENRVLEIVTKPAEIGRREALEMLCHDYEVTNG
jgi:SPP1 family predicted phage head-tail adaptor